MASDSQKSLLLTFSGRIIDHLGIQMYQSPVAAIAEIISNTWDADADTVSVTLPDELSDEAEIVIADNGIGMTFAECQERYLKVGWCRRGDDPSERSPEKDRPILGRKGIGKFAGFGIAGIIRVQTVSKENGERTVFALDISTLRTEEYVATGGEVSVIEHLEPEEGRRTEHGTTITLRCLKLGKRPSPASFAKSMARRFLLRQRAEDFKVLVNEQPLPEDPDIEGIEFRFPADYTDGEKPDDLRVDGEWGVETLSNGREIRWRVVFYKETIDDEELRGVAVFSRGKLAQRPFFFNLSGGLSGQHGQQYISGQVEADYVDDLTDDIIATERQRINWEHKETTPLEEWGQSRLQQLLRLWRDRRGEKRRRQIEEKVAAFSKRLEKLSSSEQRTIKGALKKLGAIATLSDEQFRSLGEAVLQAWEQGRLRNLIDDLAQREDVTPDWLLSTLAEADVLVALNLAEAVRTKLEGVRMLRTLVDRGELENKVRDYIAERPYLLDPKWDTYRKETSVKGILEEAAQTAELDDLGEGGGKRLDLALRSNEDLLVVEFMRPGLKADWDHLQRCLRYVTLIREKIAAQTALGIRKITGLIVADRLDDDPSVRGGLKTLTKDDIHAFDWRSLLANAERTLAEYLEIVGERAPDDERLQSLKNHTRTGSEDQEQSRSPAGADND